MFYDIDFTKLFEFKQKYGIQTGVLYLQML